MNEKTRNTFFEFWVGDVEDPDMYANMEIGSWASKNKDAYQYLLDKSDGNVRIQRKLHEFMGHHYTFTAEMSEEDWAYYYLRFSECITI